jgi:tyrosyl-tRNA synthetase
MKSEFNASGSNASGFDVLKERGFVAQMTHETQMDELFASRKVVFYIGYDPTADSLHIGHYLTFMAMAWLQRAGHVPVVLMGGGTGMVGDPDKADEIRPLMSTCEIDHNIECFKIQAAKFIDFSEGKAIMANNADWLRSLNYLDFIREYGIHFSVNRMLAAEKYRTKFEGNGLNFFELNYVIMQAYDFLMLNRKYDCALQMGGNDQWSNIIAGVDLIRRVDGKAAFGLTFNLLIGADGQKMGKTMGNAPWLDPDKLSPYDFYQHFRDVCDEHVEQHLSLLTFLPMEEIKELTARKGQAINRAKEVLAYEVTKIVHGEEEAIKAKNADNIPIFKITQDKTGEGINILDLLVLCGLMPSKSEARRNVQQGGITIQGQKVVDIGRIIRPADFENNGIMIKKGKNTFLRVVL